ncbi:MAG: ABC transporter ATP-binding protein [Devosia sp.]|nr:ABC transporter ATP-binding protein [Devosia sp.]
MQARTSQLSVRGLTHHYDGKTAIDNVSFEVASGEIAALLGPSGCGKTTVLRAIAGFLPVKPGVISLAGKDLSSLPGRSRGLGMVFQNYALFPHMTVAENIAYPLSCHGWSRERRRARVADLLSVVQLGGLERRLPRSLSGGQQQRVAVARALAVDPALLLLDEPFAALDRALRLELQMELIRLQRTIGITTIIVTHDQEEAQTLANRIIVMNKGLVEQVGSATEVYDKPASLFVNRFVGHASAIRATVRSADQTATTLQISTGEVLTLPRQLNFVAGAQIVLTARPEELTLSPQPVAGSVRATLFMSIPHGPNVLHSLALSDGTELRAIEQRDRAVTLGPGERPVFVALDANKLHAFPATEEFQTNPQSGEPL